MLDYSQALMGLGVGPEIIEPQMHLAKRRASRHSKTPGTPGLEYFRRGDWKRRGIIFDAAPVRVVGEDAGADTEAVDKL